MAEGTISGSFIETGVKGTSNEWTYFRLGDRVIAFVHKQLTGITVNSQLSGTSVYSSSNVTITATPQFMDVEHYCAAPADGSQSANVRIHRVLTDSGSFKCVLYADKSLTNVSMPVMLIIFGTWNGT